MATKTQQTPDQSQRQAIVDLIANQEAERQHQLQTACLAVATNESVDAAFVLELCNQLDVGGDALDALMQLAGRDAEQQDIEQQLTEAEANKSAAYERARELVDAETQAVAKYEKWLSENPPDSVPTAAQSKAIRKQRSPVLDAQDDLAEARRIADTRNREADAVANKLSYFQAETKKRRNEIKAEHSALYWL
ncbi:hypothetical protein CA51_11050 [Rosistilla oblonga]|uniref:hypothetical protein n=1 Tax=Rosistilla oblonga TaxID=2527990 RepID=UPI001187907D|nr:hypothetical protein [Rosistilla oblonga]QDV11244.1 hypothetical protein CA51_11050 [Rosistilla oblonga]